MLKMLCEEIDSVVEASSYKRSSAGASATVKIEGVGNLNMSISIDKETNAKRLNLDGWNLGGGDHSRGLEVILKDLSTIDDIIAGLTKIKDEAKKVM